MDGLVLVITIFSESHHRLRFQLMNSLPESGSMPKREKGSLFLIPIMLSLVAASPLFHWAERQVQIVETSVYCTVYAKSPCKVEPQCATVFTSPNPGSGFCHGPLLIGIISLRLEGSVVPLPFLRPWIFGSLANLLFIVARLIL